MFSMRLRDVAFARSGDKGTGANVGILAIGEAIYECLEKELTSERVARYFREAGATAVDRYELPNLLALNFVIHGILRRNTRVDAQGKALGQALLEMRIDLPEGVSTSVEYL
jgi:hypothetical protein